MRKCSSCRLIKTDSSQQAVLPGTAQFLLILKHDLGLPMTHPAGLSWPSNWTILAIQLDYPGHPAGLSRPSSWPILAIQLALSWPSSWPILAIQLAYPGHPAGHHPPDESCCRVA